MKRYNDFYELSWKEKFQTTQHEKLYGVKSYVSEDIDQMLKGLHNVRYSEMHQIEIYFLNQIKLFLDTEEPEKDFRLRGRSLFHKDQSSDYHYKSFDIIDNKDKIYRLGITPNLSQNLKHESNSQVISLDNVVLFHFIGQKYPEIVDYNLQPSGKQRKTEQRKESNKLIEAIETN